MRFVLLTSMALFLSLGVAVFAEGPELPAKFLSSWSVDHSENFDEYLEVNKPLKLFNSEILRLNQYQDVKKKFS